jgi:hypothetical protein
MPPRESKMIQNVELKDTKKVISRLVLQKILQHEVCKFLDKARYEDVNRIFLSSEPDRELRLDFKLQKSIQDKYYSGVADLTIRWLIDDTEQVDPEGNVWQTCTMKLISGVSSRWNTNVYEMLERAECLNALASLLLELHEMAGNPIQIQILSNDQRIARDLKRKYDETCGEISRLIRWSAPELRRGLRAGGKARTFQREIFTKIKVDPGRYEFEVNDGSNRNPKYKKYSVTIPENSAYLCAIKRVS